MRVVFDLDGTLALNGHRVHYIRQQPKDYDAFHDACVDDLPYPAVFSTLVAHARAGHEVEIWSGRSDRVRQRTEDWLSARGIDPSLLKRMRSDGDYTPDADLKRSWLNEARAAGTAPDLVYDDRDRVVAMWRAEGVPCFQVAPGPF